MEHLPTVAEADDKRDLPQEPQAPHLLALDESVACKTDILLYWLKIMWYLLKNDSLESEYTDE